MDTPAAEVELPADLTAARRARAFLRRAMCVAHEKAVRDNALHDRAILDRAMLDKALLLISELAVNAVKHGKPPVHALLACQGPTGVRLAISDGSSKHPVHQQVGPDAESGRGIGLVEDLSARWGVEVHSTGKTVWCQLER